LSVYRNFYVQYVSSSFFFFLALMKKFTKCGKRQTTIEVRVHNIFPLNAGFSLNWDSLNAGK
jgi:hypothetical protein